MSERDLRVLYLSRILEEDGGISDILVIRRELREEEGEAANYREVDAIKTSQILSQSPWMEPVLDEIEVRRCSFEELSSDLFNLARPGQGGPGLTCALCLEFEGEGLASHQTIFLGSVDPSIPSSNRAVMFPKAFQWDSSGPTPENAWATDWFIENEEACARLDARVAAWFEANPPIAA